MKKHIFFSIVILILSLAFPVFAQDDRSGGLINTSTSCVNCDLDENIGLKEIKIPIFASFIDFDTNNASILSWASFIGALATVGLVVFWIFLLVRAGVQGLQSQGDPTNLGNAYKSVQSVLVGAAVTLIFPLFLSIVGLLLGIGTIFSWPKMFQFCDDSTDYEFYYQALLDSKNNSDHTIAEGACRAIGN